MYSGETAMSIVFRNTVIAAVTTLAIASLAPPAGAAESEDLRAELAALKKRLEQVESSAKAQSVPAWVNRITWKGDLRFRNESIDQQYAPDRNRFRIRARTGLEARVNDTIRTEFALATTEGADPRASNQTLTGENSRKPILLDLAYAEWSAGKDWKLAAGKMRFPLIRPGQTSFIDADVNPEGLSVTWTRGDFFGGALYNLLEERAAAAESALVAGQFAWRPKMGPGKLSLGTGYYAFHGVQARSPFHNNAANGNSTTSVVGQCVDTTPCLVNDYDILQLFAEWSQTLAGRPLTAYADYAHNTSADNNLDTAWSLGLVWGKASEPLTWEVGYSWHDVEKDAVYGQFFESDFGTGTTDARGGVLRAGFAPARNWVINANLFLTETGVDVPATVAGVGAVRARNNRRLQIDLNFKY
jgi:hypothetical protein